MSTIAAQIAAPSALRLEHAELHDALERATLAPGEIGATAREVAALLESHLYREEEIVLPALGLLPLLAEGRMEADMADVLPLTDTLRAELPRMLAEQREICAGAERLARAALDEGEPRYARLAERLRQHAETEQRVTFPTAMLVGDYVRLRLA